MVIIPIKIQIEDKVCKVKETLIQEVIIVEDKKWIFNNHIKEILKQLINQSDYVHKQL